MPETTKRKPGWTFRIEGKAQEKLRAWLSEHDKVCRFADPMKQGAIGGRLSYMFTPTSISTILKVHCACGAVQDCTHYDGW